MGIFKFLKKLSSKEEEIREIKLEELNQFIDSLSKKIVGNADLKLVEIKEKIIKEKREMEENIQKLNDTKLKNPNIPERAKQIAIGNKEVYLQKINIFLQEVNLFKNFDESINFYDSIDKNLYIFDKATTKSNKILSEFFPDEMMSISKNIKNLCDLAKKIKKLVDDAEIEKYSKLKDKVNEIQQKIKQQENITKEIELIKTELQTQIKKINEKENKIKELEENDEYKKFSELTNKKETLELEAEEIEKQPFNYFYNIKPALKKYERLTLDYMLINEYLDNPLKALLKDKELKILEHIGKIKEFIINEKFEIKEKKKSRILKELDELTKNNLEIFLSKYYESNKKLNEVNLEIEKIEVIKEIKKIKEQFNQDKSRLEENESKIENMKEQLRMINIENLKLVLEEELKIKII
ncbi:MAG: hypothetical protein ABIH25_00220 [Candidatus Woesearchaeota archaeon]